MPNNEIQPLSADQVLLKGSILRNTDWCYGVACYTGHQTKVMKNSLKSRVKKSRAKYETEETYIFAYFTLTNAQVYF